MITIAPDWKCALVMDLVIFSYSSARDRFSLGTIKLAFLSSLRPYLLSQSSECGLWTHNWPSRTRLPPPAWTECRICSCLCPRWWCPQLCPRSGATPRSGVRLRPSPRWPAASPRATDSSPRWPESSACLYISAGRRNGPISHLLCQSVQMEAVQGRKMWKSLDLEQHLPPKPLLYWHKFCCQE